jgi:hypothetical protein
MYDIWKQLRKLKFEKGSIDEEADTFEFAENMIK